jgi:hypothetical protein
MPTLEVSAPLPTVTHEQLDTSLKQASKEKLVLAIRAVVTDEAWKQSEDALREALNDLAHETSHEYVYNALVNGA